MLVGYGNVKRDKENKVMRADAHILPKQAARNVPGGLLHLCIDIIGHISPDQRLVLELHMSRIIIPITRLITPVMMIVSPSEPARSV